MYCLQRRRILGAGAVLLASGPLASAGAAQWPEQPIRLIVPFAAGGGTDQTARILQPLLAQDLGQPVVVENRTGAGGQVGLSALAASKPDGYTMAILNIPPIVTIPIEKKGATFSLKDFIPIAIVSGDPSALSVPAGSPFKSLQDLVAYARANPGAVTVATTGVGTDDHLALSALSKAAGVKLTPVPFQGSAPAHVALIGGHVAAAAINLGENMPYVQQGKVRVLAHFGKERSSLAPDVPTAAELGLKVFMRSDHAVGFPAGVDPAIVKRVADAIERAAKSPQFVNANKQRYSETTYHGPAETAARLAELDRELRAVWAAEPWN